MWEYRAIFSLIYFFLCFPYGERTMVVEKRVLKAVTAAATAVMCIVFVVVPFSGVLPSFINNNISSSSSLRPTITNYSSPSLNQLPNQGTISYKSFFFLINCLLNSMVVNFVNDIKVKLQNTNLILLINFGWLLSWFLFDLFGFTSNVN